MNMVFERKLTIPKEVKEMYPLKEELVPIASKRAEEIKKIFTGEDERLILIIGPCSADREDAVLDYMTKLKKVSEEVKDKIFICPRLYTNKPRTTGSGYKGMLHQPNPNEKPDMFKGIVAIRKLHMRVLEETGFTCADEMLYPENVRYIDDIINYTAVGARSVENQQHRLTASGLDIPVGMKNPTSGDLSVMMNSIYAAQRKHTFIFRGWEVHSQGNPLAHAILRGYVNKHGEALTNYHYEDLTFLNELYKKSDVVNPALIVDCNHSNSGKKPFEQIRISNEILNSRDYNPDLKKLVKGLMIESYLVDGNQPVGGDVYGQSITDACLGWNASEKLIKDIADKLK